MAPGVHINGQQTTKMRIESMKVAITVWGNRISPVFDSAQTILLAEIEDGKIISRNREFLPRLVAAGLARMVAEKQIDTLICGAISARPAQIIQQSGITLLSFVGGNAERFLEDYAAGRPLEPFTMPGCREQRVKPVGTEEPPSKEVNNLS
jgi:predicted Fe-Mo cluster-binding NifX family protein